MLLVNVVALTTCCIPSVNGTCFKNLSARGLDLSKKAYTQSLNVSKIIGTKMLSAAARELAFNRRACCSIGKELSRELFVSATIWLGTLATACAWGGINDHIAAKIYPNYFTKPDDYDKEEDNPLKGYTAQLYDSFGFEPKIQEDGKGQQQQQSRKTPRPIRYRRYVWLGKRLLAGSLCVPVIHAAAGSMPKLNVLDLILPASVGLGFMAASSGLAGLCGYKLEQNAISLKN